MKNVDYLLDTASTFLLTTLDIRGFPHTIVVSRPLARIGFHTFKFYINGDGITAANIRRNEHGSICCYNPEEHRSILLKGIFRVDYVDDLPETAPVLSDYQAGFHYQNPAIATFETLIIKVHADHVDEQYALDDN